MNVISSLIALLMGISISAATPPEYLSDVSIKGAKLLAPARQRFSYAINNNDSIGRWDASAALQVENNYTHHEVDFICNHIAFLDMLSVANNISSGELLTNRILVVSHMDEAPELLCKIWVSD